MNDQRIDFFPEKVILAFSPGYCCWHCEKPLRRAFTGVCMVVIKEPAQSWPWLYLTCGQACQEHVVKVCCAHNLAPEAWSGMKVRQFLDYPEKIAGIRMAKWVSSHDLCRAIALVIENAPIN